jgi:hypothetical protein
VYNQSRRRRRYLSLGVLALLLAFALALYYISPEVHFRVRLFGSAFRHAALNRSLGENHLPPSFGEEEPFILWKITVPADPPNPLIMPKPAFDNSDGELYYRMYSASPSSLASFLRVFQSGYWLGWNWAICLTALVALTCLVLLGRKFTTLRRRGKASNSLDGVKPQPLDTGAAPPDGPTTAATDAFARASLQRG